MIHNSAAIRVFCVLRGMLFFSWERPRDCRSWDRAEEA